MAEGMTQVKFTLEAGIVSRFKSRCAAEGVSMASAVRQWMAESQPVAAEKMKTDTRQNRRKAVSKTVAMLDDILCGEESYRDNIPDQFGQRIEAAEQACERIAEAIASLEEAF